ncbi:MAG: hypothetical protein MUE41_09185 [Gemmatimonadaceae bacterium]|nr:hypothetical protein [Gemmatimonadaceae bacterium]
MPLPSRDRVVRTVRVGALILLVGCRTVHVSPTAGDAFAVVATADRLSAQPLWPGFDARTVPVAVYDGQRTVLFRHPAPPPGFVPVPADARAVARPGRLEGVTANSSVVIGGVPTATLMPANGASLESRAGILVHEAFHVFQRARHPAWSANEAALFTYPVTDASSLAARRLESEALRRALAASDRTRAGCWARTAMALRRERFARVGDDAAQYERGTEWNEGLATYVEQRAVGLADSLVVPAAEFAADAVRQRAYATGSAIGRLLYRLSPTWRESLEHRDTVALDALLTDAVATHDGASCVVAADERDRIARAAIADVRLLEARRATARTSFLAQPGWRVEVIAPDAPLFPQGFDPLNVQVVASSTVLHTRWLKLGNDAGTIEVLGRAALTEGAGAHPMFNGVRTLTVTGLAQEPVITTGDDATTVRGDGVTLTLTGWLAERSGRVITLRPRATR